MDTRAIDKHHNIIFETTSVSRPSAPNFGPDQPIQVSLKSKIIVRESLNRGTNENVLKNVSNSLPCSSWNRPKSPEIATRIRVETEFIPVRYEYVAKTIGSIDTVREDIIPIAEAVRLIVSVAERSKKVGKTRETTTEWAENDETG